MKRRVYDTTLGLVFGLCVMGLFTIWQADEVRRWERLYWEQDFEVIVHRDYGRSRDRLVCHLNAACREQKATIAQLNAQLRPFDPAVAAE